MGEGYAGEEAGAFAVSKEAGQGHDDEGFEDENEDGEGYGGDEGAFDCADIDFHAEGYEEEEEEEIAQGSEAGDDVFAVGGGGEGDAREEATEFFA